MFALVVSFGQFIVLLVYFWELVNDDKSNFVSDLLSHNRLYLNLMTFFVLLQLTACFGFVRLHSRLSSATRVAIESMFLALAWIGWCVLIVRYENGESISKMHFLGVGFFVGGGVVYFAFLIWELYEERNCDCSILCFLYTSSVTLGALFILGYFAGWVSAWIFEHLAFMTFSLSHAYLFYLDNACVKAGAHETQRVKCLLDGVRITPC